jgi:DHA2 family multidrug resistance protein
MSRAPAATAGGVGSGRAAPLPRSLAGPNNPWLVAIVVSMATFMEVLDTTVATVSLAHIAGDLSASYNQATWILTSYLVANAIVLPISGWLASVMGRKRFYTICVALFSASSLLCGMAPSLSLLIVFRILQGFAGGGLAPSAAAILRDSFPERQHGMVFAIYGIVIVAAPALGPTFGGWLTDHYGWHWVFLINVPVGILALVLSHWLLVEPELEARERRERLGRGLRIDYVGLAFVAAGLGCLQIVLDRGEQEDWLSSTFILVLMLVSAVSLAGLLVRELTIADPVVDLPLLKEPSFLAANVLRFGTFFILVGSTQLLPQLTQELYGYDAMQAGLVLTPGALLVMALTPVAGFMVNRVEARIMIALGLALEAAALWHMGGFTTDISFQHVMWARVFQGAGFALLIVPLTTIAFIGIPGNKSSEASALLNLSRNLGGAFGISFTQTWLVNQSQVHQNRLVADLTPYDATYRDAVHALQNALMQQGLAAGQAHHGAIAQLYRLVQAQAAMLSYDDVFRQLSIGALAMIPLVFLLHRRRPGSGDD